MANNKHVPWPQRTLSEVLQEKKQSRTSEVPLSKACFKSQHQDFKDSWHESSEEEEFQRAKKENWNS